MSDTDNTGGRSGIFTPPPGDEVHTYDASDDKGNRRPMLLLGILLMVAAFGGVLFIAYQQGMKEGVRTAPPIIKAEQSPSKVKPDEPGGMEIPHQDKRVYDRIAGEDTEEPPVEQLLPRAEEPMDIPAAEATVSTPPVADATARLDADSATPATAVAAAGAATDTPAATAPNSDVEILAPALQLPGRQAATPKPSNAEALRAAVAGVPQTTPAPGTAEAAPELADTVVTAAISQRPAPKVIESPDMPRGAFVVQIAAFRQEEVAKSEFRVLKKKYPELLSSVSDDIQRADLGSKGIYYRLRVGPFEERVAAAGLCEQLKSRGQDCIVRAR